MLVQWVDCNGQWEFMRKMGYRFYNTEHTIRLETCACKDWKDLQQKESKTMPIKLFVRAAEQLRSQFQQFVYRNVFPQHLQVAYTGSHFDLDHSETSTSIFEDNIWFAGPKSKVCIISYFTAVTVLIFEFYDQIDITRKKKRETSSFFSEARIME